MQLPTHPAWTGRAQRAFWLNATLPRIKAPASNIVQVSGSPRMAQASKAPNTGIRQVMMEARVRPMGRISR